MAKQALNRKLSEAKLLKEDEFYTQLSDIEKELRHYKKHFRGKVVYLQLRRPPRQQLLPLLLLQLREAGPEEAHHHLLQEPAAPTSSARTTLKQAIYLEYEGDKNGNNVPDPDEIGIKPSRATGTSAARRASSCSSRPTSW